MPRLKPLLMILPFLFAGLGAFVLAGMLASCPEPERLLFAYVVEKQDESAYPHFDLRVMDVLSGEMMYEVNSPEYDCPDEISPDGQWLLYGQSDNEIWNQEATLVNLKTGESVALPPDHIGIGAKIWEEDALIYISRTVKKGESLAQGIYRYHFGTGEIQLLATGTLEAELEFTGVQSSEGEFYTVLYGETELSIQRGNEEIASIELGEHGGGIILSTDGRYLTYMIYNNTISGYSAYVRFTEGDGRKLEDVFTLHEIPRWSPTSNVLAYLALDDLMILYNADTDETTYYELENSPYGIIHVGLWSPDGRYIIYKVGHGDEWYNQNYDLYVLDTTTGESSLVALNIVAVGREYVPWADATHLVYRYADVADIYVDDAGIYHRPYTDLWMFNVVTEENIQLTNTPTISESINCGFG